MENTAPKKTVLVGIQLPRVSDLENEISLVELSRLVTTLGYEVVGQLSQKRSSTRTATVLGDGRLKELAGWTNGTGKVAPFFIKKTHKAALKFEKNKSTDSEVEDHKDDDLLDFVEEDFELEQGPEDIDASKDLAPEINAEVVVFDCELSPSQLRNLESATGAKVLDRTGVIIEIFSRHARTKAARLQVEIARLAYLAPRMRESGDDDQQGGGGKGAGETGLELDKRKIRDRLKELKNELAAISTEEDVRRSRRDQELCVALVGYTNAGKSSLMRALTDSDVYIADKLFATLDTTVRTLHPETTPKILVSDTVGFIKKLPHDLVASFKSTLDEAKNASLLLYVVDASDDTFRAQLEVTKKVLAEVGVEDVASMLLLNKVDLLEPEVLENLKTEFPEAKFLSAKNEADITNLHNSIFKFFEDSMVEEKLIIPYTTQGAIGEIRTTMKVISEKYVNEGVELLVKGDAVDLERLKVKFGLNNSKKKKKNNYSWNVDDENI